MKAIRSCGIDAGRTDGMDGFPSFRLEVAPIYLLPPLANHLGWCVDWIYPTLTSIAPLRSHYFGLLWPPNSPSMHQDAFHVDA